MNQGKKISGGKYIAHRKKKRFEGQGQKRVIKLSEDKRRKARVRGGREKVFMLGAKSVNVMVKGNKSKKIQIKNVLETPSNRFLARQNVITKGTILETEMGRVKVTNRPTQEGTLNGILID